MTHATGEQVILTVGDHDYTVRPHVSYSQIDLFTRCGHRYFNEYIVSEPDQTDNLPSAAGTVVHEAIEYAERNGEDLKVDDLRDRLRSVDGVDDLQVWGSKDLRWWINKNFPLIVDNYTAFRVHERSVGVVPVAWELELNWTPGPHGQLFTGSVDRVGVRQSDGKAVLVDWKTGKAKPAHLLQLELYRVAVEMLGLFEVAYSQVAYLADPKGSTVPVLPSLTPEVAVDLVGQPRAGVYPFSGAHTDECRYCPVRPVCPVGSLGDSNVLLSKN